MRFAVLTVSLIGLAGGTSFAGRLLAAAEQAGAKDVAVRFDDSSRGDLAFTAEAEKPWRVVRGADELPANGFLRTSAAGPCRVQIGGGTLQLAPETQVHLVTTQRQIVVIAGRVFAQALADWSISAGALKGILSADAAAEFEIGSGERASAKVLAGAVQISGDELEPANITAGQEFVRESRRAEVTKSDLAPAEIEQLRALAGPSRKPQGLGQLVVNDPQSNSPVRLNLARYHVNVVLHPPVALVQIDQSFYNPYPAQQEGTFVFNLPEGASVSRFAMYTTPTQLVEGELIERERASKIYQSIVNRKRDPAILEQIGGNLFRMRVFPILGHDTKRILLDYTVPIVEQDEGRYAFELPLMSDLEPVWDFSITGTIRGPNVARTAHSPSHSAVVFDRAEPGAIRFALRKKSYRPEGAFVLGFQQRPAAEATVRSFVPPVNPATSPATFIQGDKIAVESQCEFLATVSPAVLEPAGRAQRAAPSPVDVLILADTSGRTVHRARLLRSMRTIAGALRPEDRFRLGCVDVDFRALTKEWAVPGSVDAEQALALLDREFFLGATDFLTSFLNAAKSLPAVEKGRRRVIVYVGDGVLPENRAAVASASRDFTDKEVAGLTATLAQADVRFSAVLGENEPSGKLLMEKLAAATGGRVFRLAGASSAELFEWALAGCPNPTRIISIKAEGAADEDVFAPTAWTPGRALHIFGRRKEAGPMKLALAFERDGKIESREWNLTMKNDLDDLFVGRLWAQRKLDQLRGSQNWAGVERQIVALSQEWTLLSPLTAFLVLESEAEYPLYGIARRTRHQYWKPDDALVEKPLPPEAIAALKTLPKATRAREAHTITSDRFDQALASARKALESRAPNRALVILGNVLESPLAAVSGEFTELKEAALDMLARGDLLRSLGPERGWFDRRRPIGFPSATTDLVRQLLHGFGSVGRHYDPWQGALTKQAQPPAIEMSLQNFINWFEAASGIPVIVDTHTLTDEGVALDQPVSLRGIHVISLDSMLKHVLRPVQLTTVVDDDALVVTTTAKAGEKLDTRLYPVADLLLTTPATDFSLFINPGLDRKLMARRRLNEKIDRRLSVDFVKAPLVDVVDFLNEKLDGNVIIDRSTLTDEGVALDSRITLKMNNVPARRILKRLCEPLLLETVLDNEAVVITTQAKAGEMLETRVHSAVGIVFELPAEIAGKRALNPWAPRRVGGALGGGMGGMGGMAMGGIGGMMGGMPGGMGFAGGGFGGGGLIGGSAAGWPGTGGTGNPASSSGAAVSQTAADGDVENTGDTMPEAVQKKESDADPAGADVDDANVPRNAGPWNPLTNVGPLDIDDRGGEPGRTLASHPSSAASTINLIESTVRPDSWEELSGPGSTMYFRYSLAFALRQTQAVHTEIEELLERVRELPTVFDDKTGWRPARVPEIRPDEVDRWDVNTLMNVLETVIQPDSWESLSGPGSMFPIQPKLALSIRQTQAVHSDIRDFLTLLRRARYLARQGRPWKSDGLMDGPWLSSALAITELPTAPKQSELPEPEAEELVALAILSEPIAGAQTWRTVSAGGRESQTTIIRQSLARSEFEFEGRLARIAGDEAAVAYPGITLVERGPWGEGLRRIVDGRLPWFPSPYTTLSVRTLSKLSARRSLAA